MHPEEGDLVLVKGDKIGDMDRYGIMAKILSPQTVLIKQFGKPFPFFPNCVLKR